MAYIDPVMAGAAEDFYAFETEEERRRRLAREAEANMPTKQTITYDNKTGAQKVKIEGSATNLSQMNPATPTVSAPVAPEDIYGRMIQAESGGRQFGPTGQVLTSPKGALGVGQIMPSTAMQPGYGVTNIFDLAQQRGIAVPSRDTAGAQQLLANEQLNREFGQNYYNAMNQRFGPTGGVAAYNAGPGRVGQNLQANAGQLNTAQLPQETQDYIQRVLGKMPGYVPGQPTGQAAIAQTPAQPAPMAPQAPTALAQEPPGTPRETAPVAPSTLVQEPPVAQPPIMMAGGTTATDVLPTATEQAVSQLNPLANRFLQVQNDPVQLAQLKQDATVPDSYKILAAKQNYDLQRQDVERQREQERLTTDERYLAKVASAKPSEEGSWGKAILFGLLGMQNSAKSELDKLGVGAKWDTYNIDGKDYLVKVRADGLPIEGIDPETGKAIPATIYQQVAGGKRELDIVGGTVVNDRTGEVGRVVTDKRTGRSYVQTDQGRKGLSGFRPQASTGSLADMRTRAIQDINLKLQGKGVEEQMAILRDYNKTLVGQGFPPVQPGEVGIVVPQIGGGAPAPVAGGQPTVPTAPAQPQGQPAPQAQPQGQPSAVAQTGAPVAPGQPRPTMSTLEAQAGAQKKEAEIVAEDVGKVRANLGQIRENADYLTTKIDELVSHPGFKYNVGVADVLGGIPVPFGATVAGLIPGTETSDWKARFEEVKGQQFLQGIQQLKGTGAISDREGAAAERAISRMRASQSETEFKEAAKDFQDIIKRGVDRSLRKAGQQPIYGTPMESESKKDKNKAEPGTKDNPIKL